MIPHCFLFVVAFFVFQILFSTFFVVAVDSLRYFVLTVRTMYTLATVAVDVSTACSAVIEVMFIILLLVAFRLVATCRETTTFLIQFIMSFANYKSIIEENDTVILYLSINNFHAIDVTPQVRNKKGELVENVFQTTYGALKVKNLIGEKYGSRVSQQKTMFFYLACIEINVIKSIVPYYFIG